MQAGARVALHRPGGVVGQKIDLARGERLEADRRREGHEFHLRGIAENGRRDGATDIGVEPLERAILIRLAEARQVRVDAADQLIARLHRFERRGLRGRARDGRCADREEEGGRKSGETAENAAEEMAIRGFHGNSLVGSMCLQ
jgi:hypothetical protein